MTSSKAFGDLNNINAFPVLEADIAKMKKMQNEKVKIEFNDPIENDTNNLDIVQSKENIAEIKVDRGEKIKNMSKEATRVHYQRSLHLGYK